MSDKDATTYRRHIEGLIEFDYTKKITAKLLIQDKQAVGYLYLDLNSLFSFNVPFSATYRSVFSKD